MAAKSKVIAKLIPDIVVSGAIVGATIWLYSVAVSAAGDANLYWQSAFFFFVAAAFLAARYYSDKVSLLRLIRWVCETISFPRGLYMTVVYAVLFAAVAIVQFIRWMF